VRWHLGAAIKAQLARGWREDQVIEVLAAPLPDVVCKPLMLARWRFAQNMPGVGPRLRPLQRAWERAHDAVERASWGHQQNRDYAAIVADVGTQTAAQMAETARRITAAAGAGQAYPVAAEQHRTMQQAATVTAARMARRDHPDQPLTTAVAAWLAAHQPAPAPVEATPAAADRGLSIADLIATTPAGRCVRCRSVGALTREDLPIPAPVCEDCWLQIAEQDTAATGSSAAMPASAGVEACGGREAC
jgi:hypothetical protein